MQKTLRQRESFNIQKVINVQTIRVTPEFWTVREKLDKLSHGLVSSIGGNRDTRVSQITICETRLRMLEKVLSISSRDSFPFFVLEPPRWIHVTSVKGCGVYTQFVYTDRPLRLPSLVPFKIRSSGSWPPLVSSIQCTATRELSRERDRERRRES